MFETSSPATPAEPVVKLFDWSDIDQTVSLIESAIAPGSCDVIVGIARSGLVPAVMLAHRLAIRDLVVLDIRRTEADSVHALKRAPVVSATLNAHLLSGRHALLVDDIVGEGRTMLMAKSWLAERCASVVSSALVVNQTNLGQTSLASVVDHCRCVVHSWVRFPWEEPLGATRLVAPPNA